jgi:hypothetical protein
MQWSFLFLNNQRRGCQPQCESPGVHSRQASIRTKEIFPRQLRLCAASRQERENNPGAISNRAENKGKEYEISTLLRKDVRVEGHVVSPAEHHPRHLLVRLLKDLQIKRYHNASDKPGQDVRKNLQLHQSGGRFVG